MAGIKLGKLPDRTPVKLTFSASPNLKQALDDCKSKIYQLIASGDIEAAKVGRDSLKSFLRSNRKEPRVRS
ncbi:MAG TPA: DUF2274 domain-containing protein [Sphingomonas sp.]|nr:DUF2274 domain-containing protein [Sphingomonas sp.]